MTLERDDGITIQFDIVSGNKKSVIQDLDERQIPRVLIRYSLPT